MCIYQTHLAECARAYLHVFLQLYLSWDCCRDFERQLFRRHLPPVSLIMGLRVFRRHISCACMHVRDARLKLTHPGDASRAGVLPRADPPPVPLIMGLLSRLRVPVSFEGTPSKPPLPLPLPLEVIFRRSASRRVVMRPYHLCYK